MVEPFSPEVKGYWGRYTFDTWRIGYSSEVMLVPNDPNYKSDYMVKYGILRETGWIFKRGWINPRDGKKYKSIHTAISLQRLWENTEGAE